MPRPAAASLASLVIPPSWFSFQDGSRAILCVTLQHPEELGRIEAADFSAAMSHAG
jgi:hypothetical protein